MIFRERAHFLLGSSLDTNRKEEGKGDEEKAFVDLDRECTKADDGEFLSATAAASGPDNGIVEGPPQVAADLMNPDHLTESEMKRLRKTFAKTKIVRE